MICFTGSNIFKIDFIKGEEKNISIRDFLTGAVWQFYPDGKFFFTPSKNVTVRDDVYPIPGEYRKENNIIIFRGERKSPLYCTASVDGIIFVDTEIIMEGIYAINASASEKIVVFDQNLLLVDSNKYAKPVISETEDVKKLTDNIFVFHGEWQLGDFQKISLRQVDKRVRGTFIGCGGGIIEGVVHCGCLEFTWRDEGGNFGWGFLRAVAYGATLVGFYGYFEDKTRINVLVGYEGKSYSIEDIIKNIQDELELKYLGYELVNSGRCGLAVEVLEHVLRIYEKKRLANTNQIIKNSIQVTELDVFGKIYYCCFFLADYDKMLQYMVKYLMTWRILNETIDVPKDTASNLGFLTDYLERWRAKLLIDIEKINLIDKAQTFFEDLVSFLSVKKQGTEALIVSEKARARAFVDLLATRSSIRKDRESNFFNVTEISSPSVAPPLAIHDIYTIVKHRRSVCIEYFLTEDKLVIWVIPLSGCVITIVNNIKKAELERLVGKYISLIRPGKVDEKQRNELSKILQELYNQLIKPIPEDLLPVDENEVITIIPHGFLFYISFASLKDENGVYFIEKHPLVYSSSIATLKYTKENRIAAADYSNANLLAFVNPKPYHDPKLPSLDNTERHFEVFRNYYSYSNVLYGKDARKNILQIEVSQYTVIYFATHARFIEDEPMESHIALAKVDSEDGKLKVLDIYNLSLNADLVILAACETGMGKVSGDGIVGLSRAFIWSGTSSVLMTLWPVYEDRSLVQMYYFHEFRQEKNSKAHALRRSQLKELEEYPYQPGVWSGFVLFGEWE